MQMLYPSIRTAGELASEYVDCIVADRDQKKVDEARTNLAILIKPGSIKGIGPLGGGPKTDAHWADILFIYGMAYGWVGQIRFAEALLRKFRGDPALIAGDIKECLEVDLTLDAIKNVMKGDLRASKERSKVARSTTASILNCSESHVHKTVYCMKNLD
jgi:hypothetical protein